jgi:hypothetical protein
VPWETLGGGHRPYAQVLAEVPRKGCGLVRVLSAAWESSRPGASLYLLRPATLSPKEPGPLAAERLRRLAARCGFEHRGTAPGPEPEGPGQVLEEYRRLDDLKWRVGDAAQRHREALRAVFRASFGHDIAPDLWQWKYGGGRGCGTVVWAGDRIVAHYGVVSRDVSYLGRDARAWLVGDVMVEPRERGALTKQGPFFLASASCSDACLAFDEGHLLGVGFPNARHMRLAERTGIYREVGRVRELRWDLADGGAVRETPCHRLSGDAAGRWRPRVDRLWERMRADLPEAILGRRDWAYLERRYLAHPLRRYRVLLVPGRLRLGDRGLVVLHCEDADCELLDVVGRKAHLPVLVEAAKAEARRAGARLLKAWITSGFVDRFRPTGCTDQELDVALPTSVWAPGPDVEAIRDRWWLTLGDTDFH